MMLCMHVQAGVGGLGRCGDEFSPELLHGDGCHLTCCMVMVVT